MNDENNPLYVVIAMAFVAALIFVFGVAGASVMADGQITYCYVNYYSPQEMPPVYRLKGFRPWREDRTIGTFTSMPEALKAAESMKCPVEAKVAK